jgi:hypothetical protein
MELEVRPVLVSRASRQRDSSLDNAAASWALAPGCLVRACTCDRVANAPRRAAEPVLCVVREGAVRPPTEAEEEAPPVQLLLCW